MRKNGLIIVGDLHLRDTAPICRTDDWWGTMERKLKFIRETSLKKSLPVFFVGDLFDETYRNPNRPSYKLLNLFHKHHLIDKYHTIIGNHDLPAHNTKRYEETGLCLLDDISEEYERVSFPFVMKGWERVHPEFVGETQIEYEVFPFHWGDCLDHYTEPYNYKKNRVALVHKLCWRKEKPFPDAPDDGNAEEIMRQLEGFDLIAIGDNHQKFVVETEDQLLINPGSVFRLTAAQKDHEPAIFAWYGGKDYEEIPIPIEHGVISSEHLDEKKDMVERVQGFIDALRRSEGQVDLDFLGQLRRTVDNDAKLPNRCKEIIYQALEEVQS